MSRVPFFSVIVPSFNRAHIIGATLKTIINQSFSDFEILVVDDGSSDDTEDVVMRVSDHRITYYKRKNAERGAARNFGAQQAKGSYINFFDSDDLMHENHLKTAYDFIAKASQPEWFHLAYDYRNEANKVLAVIDNLGAETEKKLLFDNVLSCNGVIIRRDIVRAFPFQEERALASSEDWELWIRLACRFKFNAVNTVTSTVVGHAMRSLNTINPDAAVKRDILLIAFLSKDELVAKAYGGLFKRFISERYTFFMLLFAAKGDRDNVLFWAKESLKVYFPVIFTRRYLAALKNIFIS